MSDWQLIETAPRDGTEFLAWDGSGYHVVYSHEFELSNGNHAWFNGDVYVKPTHWQPLPDPPEK